LLRAETLLSERLVLRRRSTLRPSTDSGGGGRIGRLEGSRRGPLGTVGFGAALYQSSSSIGTNVSEKSTRKGDEAGTW